MSKRFSEIKSGDAVFMASSNIGAPHGFTTRAGGVSQGIYATLNLGAGLGDDEDDVRQNYGILARALDLGPCRFVFSRQVHGAQVRVATRDDLRAPCTPVPYEADGLVTREADVPLVIFTADCVPILLHDPVGGAVGAVHAGWRGTAADIAGEAVAKMAAALGSRPGDIRAAIGPCISRCCFETGGEVAEAMERALGADAAGPFIRPRGEKRMIDLKGINGLLLERAGVKPENIAVSPDCTSCRSGAYWSHRVTGGRRGSQAAVIMLKGTTY